MNGIILIDKQKEYTSHDVVAIVKKISKEKVGHTGTLDPMATGVLPLLIGSATKIAKYLVNHDKTYIAEIKLGIKTDTADSEGKVIEEKEVPNLTEEKIQEAFNLLIGKQEQIPPMYSAIKVNGKKLYEYARQGKKIDIPSRRIEIYDLELINFDKENGSITFKLECSKGTYVRTVCEKIAENLKTVGFMQNLRRTKVGEFGIENSITIDELRKDESILEKRLITLEEIFNNKEKIGLDNKQLELFLNGVMLTKEREDGIYLVYNGDKFIGLGIIKNKLLKRDVVL